MANRPPPLPPRTPSEVSLSSADESTLGSRPRNNTTHLTPHSASRSPSPQLRHPYSGGFEDPRSSSTQSLRPVESAGANRRTLLLIYIHGFLGDETSFKSFPAHVHNILTTTLVESHVVYSKIYPRYKSRRNISFARDDFSNWLAPHESPKTDVILVGHSLGGILGGEVVLIPATSGDYEFRHRILGIVAIDVPFLGMHPGVVSTGISSLFRSPPEEAEDTPSTASVSQSPASPSSTFSDPSLDSSDPNFNPAYANDVHLAKRKGKLNRAWYFWNKHWGELGKATQSYVTSHLEFGGCLADYPGLRRRYDAIRALEDVDEYSRQRASSGRWLRRVRFVNYYSASTGRIKEREPSPTSRQRPPPDAVQGLQNMALHPGGSQTPADPSTRTPSPRISLEEHRDGQIVSKQLEEVSDGFEEHYHVDSDAAPVEASSTILQQNLSPKPSKTTASVDEFPPLPPLPDAPEPFDDTKYANPDALSLARKEHDRQVKAYERTKKERDKTFKDREKFIQKQEKAALKEQQKQQKEQLKRSSTLNPDEYDKQLNRSAGARAPTKKQKDRKFCSLPSKDPRTGKRDPTWVRVYMEGIDEVVAHTSMFKISETYAKLVGDTVVRVEDWVNEDATRRAVLEVSEGFDAPGKY